MSAAPAGGQPFVGRSACIAEQAGSASTWRQIRAVACKKSLDEAALLMCVVGFITC